jgi:hypothetical protein
MSQLKLEHEIALAIAEVQAGSEQANEPLSPEHQQQVTAEMLEHMSKVEAQILAGTVKGLVLIAVGQEYTTVAVNSHGYTTARLAYAMVDKGHKLALEFNKDEVAEVMGDSKLLASFMLSQLQESKEADKYDS